MLIFIVFIISLCLNCRNKHTQITNVLHTAYYIWFCKYALLFELYLMYFFWQDGYSNVQVSSLVQFGWEMPVPILFWAGCIVFKVSRPCQITWCVWWCDLEFRKQENMTKEKQVTSDISVKALLLQELITYHCCS